MAFSFAKLNRMFIELGQLFEPFHHRVINSPDAWKEMGIMLKEFRAAKIKGNLQLRSILRQLEREGAIEWVTGAHADAHLSVIGKTFEDMQAHPLVKKYSRRKLGLVYDRSGKLLGEEQNVMMFLADKFIVIPKQMDYRDTATAIDFIGHETGHHLQLDISGRASVKYGINTQSLESGADEVAAVISPHHGRFIQKDLAKDVATEGSLEQQLEQASHGNWLTRTREKLKIIDRAENKPGAIMALVLYPPASKRISAIESVARRMADPSARTHMEKELDRRLGRLHDSAFPHRR